MDRRRDLHPVPGLRLAALTLLQALIACADGNGDTGGTDSAPPPDTNPDGLYFDTYAVGWDLAAGFDGSDLRSVVVQGVQESPMIEVSFYEQDWFESGEDRHRCSWIGEVATESSDELGVGGALWVGWSASLALVDTTCAGFSPIRWGEDTPTGVLESEPLGIGFGPSSEDFTAELYESLRASGWSEADWEASFGPFLYSTWFAASGADGDLEGAEINMTRTFQVDDDWNVITDESGASTPLMVGDGQPPGYVRSQSWKLFDARAWFPIVGGE